MKYKKYIDHLKSDGVLVYPTDTVWGIGADYQSEKGTNKIFEIKGRNQRQALSVLVLNIAMAKELAVIDNKVEQLMKNIWPGPVTFVLPAKDTVKSYIHGGTNFVGLRCSPLEFVHEFLVEYGRPITSTSVNPSGEEPARSREDLDWIKDQALIVEEYDVPMGQENKGSTVVKITDSKCEILREGDFPVNKFLEIAKEYCFQVSVN